MIWQIFIVLGLVGVVAVLSRRLPTVLTGGQLDRWLWRWPKVSAAAVASLTRSISQRMPRVSLAGFRLPRVNFRNMAQKPVPPPLAVRPAVDTPHINKDLEEADRVFAAKQFDAAEKSYIKAAAKEPSNPKIYGRLGVIYLHQKNYLDAREALLTSLKFEKTVGSRHYNLALAYQGLGDRAKARFALEKAIQLDPVNDRYKKLRDQLIS